jgi:hypothetical protein
MTNDMSDWSDEEHDEHEEARIREWDAAHVAAESARWAKNRANRNVFGDRVFSDEVFRRLANDVVAAADEVHAGDGDFRWSFLPLHFFGSGHDEVAVINVRTQRHPSNEGQVFIRPGMSKSRIVQLIREKIRPTPDTE